MVTSAALERLTAGLDFLKGIPLPLKYQVKPRTQWQKIKDKSYGWRHALACWITPYGFDD